MPTCDEGNEHSSTQYIEAVTTILPGSDYERYLRHYHGSATREDEWDTHPDYGTSCHYPGEALRGCPALKKLIIEIDYSKIQHRKVDPSVYGGHESNRRAKFYREIATFLKLLAETSDEELGVASNPVLILTNPYKSKVRQDWCEEYMRDELLPLLRAVAENHPSLTIQVPMLSEALVVD
ncbi:uncharacterized protein PITG_16748 [Phytophthora infestans T30-4]|uniref:Uncharacterized protein n=1 Tax=Phytophthora infestans (strain T30-4) TaxID=403677 RepID=D0NVI9_PHYIT|nr:uncharacterized protein PITG_16748 [Phytophthora infestans T30-4]EEY66666.1 conserved hypothetical protein [Phytophthora infestans T30-4]|eukprot:XP_002896967.1 conserved hypothetical protein [Phytophthora infestans T30-4]